MTTDDAHRRYCYYYGAFTGKVYINHGWINELKSFLICFFIHFSINLQEQDSGSCLEWSEMLA